MRDHLVYTGTLLLVQVYLASATYISYKSAETPVVKKTNDISQTKRYGLPFNSDRDILRYLKLYGRQMMLWRCRNAIQPYWDYNPIPSIELYCEGIGRLKSFEWFFNGKKINIDGKYVRDGVPKKGGRYAQMIMPHLSNGKYFSRWIDFRLKIYNATLEDSGIYSFRLTGPRARTDEQLIYVDISEKKRKRSRQRDHRAQRHRLRSRNKNYPK